MLLPFFMGKLLLYKAVPVRGAGFVRSFRLAERRKE